MKILLYSVIALFGVLAVIGWQQANALSYQITVRDATIDNLMGSLSQAQNKIPEIVYLVEEKPVVIEKLVYQEKPVYIDRPIEKLVYKELTDFQNLAELQQFVGKIGIVVVFDEAGTLGCYDNALFYWRQAYEQGKRVFLDSVEPAEYNRYFTKRIQRPDEGHIVVGVVIGRRLYWLDPSTAEIILRGGLLK